MFESLFSALPWSVWLVLLLGFVPLILGADRLVEGGSAIAARFRVPPIAIGLTIVAFGTSAPELVVTLLSAIGGQAELALGNVLGSNIINVLLILGLTALVRPLAIKADSARIEIPLALLAALLVFLFANDSWLDGAERSAITRIDGLVLLVFMGLFLAYNYRLVKLGQSEEQLTVKAMPLGLAGFWVLAGLALLVLGGKMIVDGAVAVAQGFGMPERLIGLTVLALGTSLPELATSIVAAAKGNSDIAVGNIIGSNIFNVFFVLALSASLAPVPVGSGAQFDSIVHIAALVLLTIIALGSRRSAITRPAGAVLVAAYLAYISWLVFAS